MKILLLFIGLFLISQALFCQNSCFRIPFKTIDCIPNPSFEIPQQCNNSTNFSHLYYPIPGWSTSDPAGDTYFLHSCGNFTIAPETPFLPGNNAFFYPPAPQPVPDGHGVVGVTDMPEWNFIYKGVKYYDPKSYVFTALHSVLHKDSLYQFSFYAGFGLRSRLYAPPTTGSYYYTSPSPETFSLFGISDSTQMAAPVPVSLLCPVTYNKGWLTLGSVTVTADSGTWDKASIIFMPTKDIQAIAIGPSCAIREVDPHKQPRDAGRYLYFLDKLQFSTAAVPMPLIDLTAGSLCDSPEASATLHMRFADFYKGSQLQWFKNNQPLPNETNGTLTVEKNTYGAGWYQCRVQNDSVCLISDSMHVYWVPRPLAHLGGGADTVVCLGDTVLLNAFTDTTATYVWNNGSTQPVQSITQPGLYKVTVKNACATVEASKQIRYTDCPTDLFIPSAFTPNGDGLNDVFRIRYRKKPQDIRFSIYNRTGQRIFFSTDPDKGWNGTLKSMQQPNATYVWMLSYTSSDGKNHRMEGTVVLIR